jgi:hypothetical protein
MRRLPVLSVCAILFSVSAHASPITYTVGGTMSIVHPGLSPFVVMGSNLTWSFTIDSDAPDLLPLDPAIGKYALGSSSWLAGSLTGTATGGSIEFTDNLPVVGDSIGLDGSGMTFSSAAGFTPTRLHLILWNQTNTAFDSDDPPTNLDISMFNVSGLGMAFDGFPLGGDFGDLSVFGPLEFVAATPAPEVPKLATLLLLGSSLVASYRRLGSRPGAQNAKWSIRRLRHRNG